MPTASSEQLEWNEENLSKVIADLYREAESDQTLHDRLMNDPFETLNSRINVPEEYRGGIFAREKHQQTLVLYVPANAATRARLPEGTAEVEQSPDYEVVCTTDTLW